MSLLSAGLAQIQCFNGIMALKFKNPVKPVESAEAAPGIFKSVQQLVNLKAHNDLHSLTALNECN